MNHEQKVNLAEKILGRIEEKYGDMVHVGGIYGSVARGDDTELSDIDMIIIRKNDTEEIHNEFFFNGIPVSYRSLELREAEEKVVNPTFEWPWSVNSIINFQVFIGDKEIQEDLRKKANGVPGEKLRRAAAEQLPNVYEYYNKVKKYYKKGDKNNLFFAVWDILNGILGCVALINKEYFIKNDFYRFQESFSYDKTPENYEELIKKCYSSKDSEKIFRSMVELFENFEMFMSNNGVEIDRYTDLNNLNI